MGRSLEDVAQLEDMRMLHQLHHADLAVNDIGVLLRGVRRSASL